MIAVCLLALCVSPDARAHDPFEIWTMAVLRTEHLELAITMAQSTALRLIDPQAKAGAITFENFPQHRARLEKAAPMLCVLTSGRKPLAAQKVDVELTDENDIVFRVAFLRPPPGRLHFRAACLQKLGQGYGSLLDVSADDGDHLGWEQLSFENPSFEVTIPPPAPRKK